jgi:hypothetical protein
MDDAVLLGQIRIQFISSMPNSRERKREFMLLMQVVFSDLVQEATGIRPSWPEPPVPAPEHEKGQIPC